MTRLLTLLLTLALALAATAPAQADVRKKEKKERHKSHLEQREQSDAAQLPVPMTLPTAPRPEARVKPLDEPAAGGRRFHTGNFDFSGRRGIDVSHYQHTIDWARVARDPQVNFVILKATEGTDFVDSHYADNLRLAQQAGLPVGAYHFFSPKLEATAEAQYANFKRVVDPRTQDIIPVVDVEQRGSISLTSYRQRLQRFCDLIERDYGVKPIIYVGHYYYQKYLSGMFYGYKVWCARYMTDQGVDPPFEERCRLVLWQHSCKGSIQGITGHVDLNRFCGQYTLKDILLR